MSDARRRSPIAPAAARRGAVHRSSAGRATAQRVIGVVTLTRRRRASASCCSSGSTATASPPSRPAAGRPRSASPSSPTASPRSCCVVGVLMLLAVLVFAIGQPGAEDDHVGFHPVYLVLAAGVAVVVPHRRPVQPVRRVRGDADGELRADHPRGPSRPGAQRHDLRRHQPARVDAVPHRPGVRLRRHRHGQPGRPQRQDRRRCPSGVRSGLAVLLIVVFGIKAAIFPLFFWLPDSYPTAPTPVTAVFAGLLTKVGVYAHHPHARRCCSRPTPSPARCCSSSPALTMVVGVLGAIAQDDIKRILSFHIVSQIGYMIMGLGLFTRRRARRRRPLHRPPHRREDHPVPRRRPGRAARRHRPSSPSSSGLARARAAPRACCSSSRR